MAGHPSKCAFRLVIPDAFTEIHWSGDPG
uniref:Uncharacterized protein n=1 Tax=Anguilla anguilla TaxID=7936 RepID=A0A0E9R550_ANGAN